MTNKYVTKVNGEVIEIDESQIVNSYLAEGLSEKEISKKYMIPIDEVQNLIIARDLKTQRRQLISEGLKKIQNKQIIQAKDLMKLETNFKKLKLIQLQNKLHDYMAYYAKHGDFYKRHMVTGEVLKDMSGIPLQLEIPNVSKEINQLKESVNMSEGLKKIIDRIDDILNEKSTSTVRDLSSAVDDFFGD